MRTLKQHWNKWLWIATLIGSMITGAIIINEVAKADPEMMYKLKNY